MDWYNAQFQVYFKLVKYADGTGITAGVNGTTTNGHTFIREIQVECNVITISNNTKVNGSSNVLSKSYAELVGKDHFFYPDTSTGSTEAGRGQALYDKLFATRTIFTDDAAENKI